MKLLFDRQLGPSLVLRLADIFPNSQHVDEAGLSMAADAIIWDFAKALQFVIVSKDKDFESLSAVRWFPPKVVLLRIGNCTVAESADVLRKHTAAIYTFAEDDEKALLSIG